MIELVEVVVDKFRITFSVKIKAPKKVKGLEYNYANSLIRCISTQIYTATIFYIRFHQENLDAEPSNTCDMSFAQLPVIFGQLPVKQTEKVFKLATENKGLRYKWYNDTDVMKTFTTDDLVGLDFSDTYPIIHLAPGEVLSFDIYPRFNNGICARPFGDHIGFKDKGKGIFHFNMVNKRMLDDDQIRAEIGACIDIVNDEPGILMTNIDGVMNTPVILDKEGNRVPKQ